MSLNRKIIITVLLLQLPYLAFIAAVHFYFRPQILPSLSGVDNQKRALLPIGELQSQLFIANDHLGQYLIDGNPASAKAFSEISKSVNQRYAIVLTRWQDTPKIKAFVARSQQQWKSAHESAGSLLALEEEQSSEAASRDARFAVQKAIEHLGRASEAAFGDIQRNVRRAELVLISLNSLFTVLFCCSLVLSLLVTLYIVHYISQPLRAIEEAAEQFESGDYSSRVTLDDSSDQIGSLKNTFNSMAEKIETSIRMLQEYSLRDELSGLYNRREFDLQLAHEINRCQRQNGTFSLALFDLDKFKQINDTYGHRFGDVVIRRFSEILKQTVRVTDIPARYGGEEFALILVGADAVRAAETAERVRARLEAHAIKGDDDVLATVTVSAGVASYPNCAQNENDLFEAADRALYRSKGDGRNRVSIAPVVRKKRRGAGGA